MSSGPARGSGSRPSRSSRPTTTARSTRGRPTRRSRSRRISIRPSTCERPSRPVPTRSTRATASSPRTPPSPPTSGGRAHLGRADARGAPARRRQARREADGPRGRRADAAPGHAGRDRLPARRQGRSGRRRPRHACRPLPGELDEALAAARREAAGAFGDDTVFCERYLERPRHVEAQLLGHGGGHHRPRRARLLDPAASPEAGRGGARSRARSAAPGRDRSRRNRLRRGDRLPQRRHCRVPRGRADVYFLELNGRIQVEHPVTEARDRARHRRAATSRRRRRGDRPRGRHGAATQSRCGSTPRIRGRSCPRPGASTGSSCRRESASTRASRRETRSGSLRPPAREADRARRRPRGGDRRGCATRSTRPTSRGSSRTSHSCAGSSRHPAFRAGAVSTAFLVEHPPLSAPPLAHGARGRSRGPWRLNLPPPRPRTRPDVDPSLPGAGAGHGTITAPMPGTVIGVERRAGRQRHRPAAARRPRGDEDGDAGAWRRSPPPSRPSTSRPAIRSRPAAARRARLRRLAARRRPRSHAAAARPRR